MTRRLSRKGTTQPETLRISSEPLTQTASSSRLGKQLTAGGVDVLTAGRSELFSPRGFTAFGELPIGIRACNCDELPMKRVPIEGDVSWVCRVC